MATHFDRVMGVPRKVQDVFAVCSELTELAGLIHVPASQSRAQQGPCAFFSLRRAGPRAIVRRPAAEPTSTGLINGTMGIATQWVHWLDPDAFRIDRSTVIDPH